MLKKTLLVMSLASNSQGINALDSPCTKILKRAPDPELCEQLIQIPTYPSNQEKFIAQTP